MPARGNCPAGLIGSGPERRSSALFGYLTAFVSRLVLAVEGLCLLLRAFDVALLEFEAAVHSSHFFNYEFMPPQPAHSAIWAL